MWTHEAKEHFFAAIRAMNLGQCCESGMFIPDFFILDPRFRVQGQKDFGSRIGIRKTGLGALVPKMGDHRNSTVNQTSAKFAQNRAGPTPTHLYY
jgi:hypothetical protein